MGISITKNIRSTIHGKKRGWVFSPKELVSKPGQLTAAEKALSRLAQKGEIRRLRRGIYYYPKISKRWGELPPEPHEVVKALSRAWGTKFVPSGAIASHRLGLTNQVPLKQVYLTTHSAKIETVGNLTIEFRKAVPAKLSGRGQKAGIILSAIEHLGKVEAFAPRTQKKIASKMTHSEIAPLLRAAQHRSSWVKKAVQGITNKVQKEL